MKPSGTSPATRDGSASDAPFGAPPWRRSGRELACPRTSLTSNEVSYGVGNPRRGGLSEAMPESAVGRAVPLTPCRD